ncbi:MAG: DUF3443 family protein [Janthinobacterium lividum]
MLPREPTNGCCRCGERPRHQGAHGHGTDDASTDVDPAHRSHGFRLLGTLAVGEGPYRTRRERRSRDCPDPAWRLQSADRERYRLRASNDRCATIDDVMIDTGSAGLRLESSAVPPFLRLPAFSRADGKQLAECLRFVHDDAWRPLVRADLHMNGMMAADLPIQIIADDGRPQPTACPVSTTKATSNGYRIGKPVFRRRGSSDSGAYAVPECSSTASSN